MRLASVSALALIAMIGCGPPNGTVQGEVTVDGKPLEEGS